MSNRQTRRKIAPPQNPINTPGEAPEPQEFKSPTPADRKKLKALGYAPKHLEGMSREVGKDIIAAQAYRPGSRAYNKAHGSPLPDKYTDEGIEATNRSRDEESDVYVVRDEYTQKCLRGEDPINQLLLEYEAANPGKRFRLINPDLPGVAGPQFQPVYDKKGERVALADLQLGWMPDEVYVEEYQKPNLKRSRQMAGQIKLDGMDNSQAAKKYAPTEGDRMQARQSSPEVFAKNAIRPEDIFE
jgi:hypothetical protein